MKEEEEEMVSGWNVTAERIERFLISDEVEKGEREGKRFVGKGQKAKKREKEQK